MRLPQQAPGLYLSAALQQQGNAGPDQISQGPGGLRRQARQLLALRRINSDVKTRAHAHAHERLQLAIRSDNAPAVVAVCMAVVGIRLCDLFI
jgi:hypothetical protein